MPMKTVTNSKTPTSSTEQTTNHVDELSRYCLRCGRKLRSEQARLNGMGKICLEKSKQLSERRKLFDADSNP